VLVEKNGNEERENKYKKKKRKEEKSQSIPSTKNILNKKISLTVRCKLGVKK
jgi:hypothetical protein